MGAVFTCTEWGWGGWGDGEGRALSLCTAGKASDGGGTLYLWVAQGDWSNSLASGRSKEDTGMSSEDGGWLLHTTRQAAGLNSSC